VGGVNRQGKGASGLDRYAGEIEAILADLAQRQTSARIWRRDASLWKAEPDHQKIIRNSLGWPIEAGLRRVEEAAGRVT